MQTDRWPLLLFAAAAGLATPPLLPQSWLFGIFMAAVATAVMAAMVSTVDANEARPAHAWVGMLALLVVGISRPRANLASGPTGKRFLVALVFLACYTASLLALV